MKNILLTASLIALTGCSIVGPGERGVRVSLGSVSEDAKQPGAYLWVPVILGMSKINVQIQNKQIEASSASKDMQEIHATVAVNWSLSPEKVVTTYKQIGDEDDVVNRILTPAVNEVMKSATAKRTAEEVLTKRMEMKKDIDSGLVERLSAYGITLHDVSIVNLRFSNDFTNAIEKKQIAEQEAKQAEYTAQKATQEAKAEVERAKGQAASQQLVRASITKEILEQKAIEKWDGHFPQYMGGNGVLPFINLSK